ncbi:MAG TPA: hypothetical protein VHH15_00490 [Actinophytocola sp.]|nr:hypothetical protein [Actinophytocola sp.]
MAIARRTLLRSAGVAAFGLPATSCLGVAPGAVTFLRTVGLKLAEGFGMAVGSDIAAGVHDLVSLATEKLPQDKGERIGSTVVAAASKIVDDANFKVAVAANFKQGGGLEDEELTSYAVHLNADGEITAPSVVTLGLCLLARESLDATIADHKSNGQRPNLPAIHEWIRERLSINFCEPIGGSERLDQFGVFRVLTTQRRNIEFEWDPTTSSTEQCRLTIRDGIVMKGLTEWTTTRNIPIPSHLVWD